MSICCRQIKLPKVKSMQPHGPAQSAVVLMTGDCLGNSCSSTHQNYNETPLETRTRSTLCCRWWCTSNASASSKHCPYIKAPRPLAAKSRINMTWGTAPTGDPGQHGLQDFSPRSANDHAHDVLLLLHREVLIEEGPQLVFFGLDVLLQGGPHCRTHALQAAGVLT